MFQALKDAFIDCTKLSYPDYDHQLILETDSSLVVRGYYYKKWKETSTVHLFKEVDDRREALGHKGEGMLCAGAIKKFSPWLQHAVAMDHESLKYLMFLSQYDLLITHLRGKDNHIADYLSRAVDLEEDEIGVNIVSAESGFGQVPPWRL